MRYRYSFIVFIAGGIALWLGYDVPNGVDRTIAAHNSVFSPTPVTVVDPPATDAKPTGTEAVTAGEVDAVRDVSVFGGAFIVRVDSYDMLEAFTPYRDLPIADYYDSLAQAANAGDSHAAHELGFVLMRCVGYATTKQELDDKLNTMRQTHLIESPYQPQPRLVEDISAWIDIEHQRYEICKGLSKEQVTGFRDWFALAAELGEYHARVEAIGRALDRDWLTQGLAPDVQGFDNVVDVMRMFAAAEPEGLRRAIEHMFAARAQGSLQALHDLALLYAAGVLQPPNQYSPTANAYANLRAASEVWQKIWEPGSYSYDEDLRRLSDRLSMYELDWAEAQAQAILREGGCCKDP